MEGRVIRHRRKSFHDFRAFEGPDVDIKTSLRDYGLVWKLVSKENEEYLFVYGVQVEGDQSGDLYYSHFAYARLNAKQWRYLIDEPWFKLNDVAKTCGLSVEDFSSGFPYHVEDAVRYHGGMNIFGDCYDASFTIGRDFWR